MIAEIKDGFLHIKIPVQTPTVSKSGKSKIVASTRGNKPTAVEVEGKSLVVSVNAYVPIN